MRVLFFLAIILFPSIAHAIDFGVDAKNYDTPRWSPYLVGGAIGVLSCLTFYFSDKPIGASSFYATVAGFIGKGVAPRHTKSLEYFKSEPPKFNWEFVFVIFTILGGLLAAWTGDDLRNEWLHPMWVDRFGDSVGLRAVIGFAGGALMGFGARLAGGCTSGHGISGTLQLNVGSWLSVVGMFIGGVATAMLLYTIL
jgi:uncharacterized membrane protein YedE/YeeE